jgi:hypothetical protein
VTTVIERNKKIIFAIEGKTPEPIRSRCHFGSISKFKAPDYESICQNILKENAADL